MGESSFDIIAALNKKKAELEGQIKEATKETTPPTEMAGPSGIEKSRTVFSPAPVTEEDKKRFTAVSGPDLAALPEQEQRMMESVGKRVLREQMDKIKEGNSAADAAAATAEKMLYLSQNRADRWNAAEDLMVAHSKKGLTYIVHSTDTRSLEGLCGGFPETIAGVRSRVKDLPETGSKGWRTTCLLITLAMVAVALLVFLHPGIAALFTEERVEDVLVAVGAIATIAMFFLGGFWGAAITLVVLALLFAGAQAIMPLALFGKLLVVLVAAVIGIFTFSMYCDENRKLKPEIIRKRSDDLAWIRKEAEKCRRYGKGLIRQVETYLKEDEALQSDRDDEIRQHHREIQIYIRQYRDKIKSLLSDLDREIPNA